MHVCISATRRAQLLHQFRNMTYSFGANALRQTIAEKYPVPTHSLQTLFQPRNHGLMISPEGIPRFVSADDTTCGLQKVYPPPCKSTGTRRMLATFPGADLKAVQLQKFLQTRSREYGNVT